MGNPMHGTYDALLEMKDDGLVAASAAWQVDSAAKILDLGGGGAAALEDGAQVFGNVLIEVSAIEIASNDEIYDLIIQGSPDADFGTAGNIVELAAISLSAKEVKRSDSDADDAAGRYIIPFTNWRNGTHYRYVRGYTVVAGTIATGIDFTARMTIHPR